MVGDAGRGDDCADSARALYQREDDKEIARDLRVSRNTVRKVLRSGETSFEYEREVQPRSARSGVLPPGATCPWASAWRGLNTVFLGL